MASDIVNSQYGARARKLVDLAQSLRAAGAHELLNIPQIVVIGGQSAGKSSLVEAVSGIRVPRDSGTCTRCPMECNLKRDDGPWSCQITLRKEYDASNNPLSRPEVVSFGPRINNPEDVELMLRRAQAAILCPWLDPNNFVSLGPNELKNQLAQVSANSTTLGLGHRSGHSPQAGSDDSESTTADSDFSAHLTGRDTYQRTPLKFSRNTICLEIKDPEAANLTFVDLPGLIQNEEPEVVQLVEGLVRENITRNCLILVTIPMSDDMENQRAKRLSKEVDPEGVRTIGVLTKPDTLTAGSINALQKWKEILLSSHTPSQHALQHGYYCVKLADDVERASDIANGTSMIDRQAREFSFFSSTDPWAQLVVGSGRDRFGVVKLVQEMSSLLTRLLDEALPHMLADAERQLAECYAELRRLPEPRHVDALVEILRLVNVFCQNLNNIVYGCSAGVYPAPHDDDPSSFGTGAFGALTEYIRQNRDTYEVFKSQLYDTVPDFRPFEDSDEYRQPSYDGETDNGTTMDLTGVRQVINESLSWELPHNIPFSAKQRLIEDFIRQWAEPAYTCFEAVVNNLEGHLTRSVDHFFDQYPQLRQHIGMLVMDQLRRQREDALRTITKLVTGAKFPSFTQNISYFETLREKWILNYRDVRKRKQQFLLSSSSATEDYSEFEGLNTRDAVRRAVNALAELGYHEMDQEKLKRLNPPDDDYEEEIVVMADVKAYFHVTYKRMIDTVPLAIEHSLNQAFCSSLQVSILQKLRFGEPDASERLGRMMAEDPKIVKEREVWQVKRERLEKVLNELKGFGA